MADKESGRVIAGVEENANSTMAESAQRRMRRIRKVRTATF